MPHDYNSSQRGFTLIELLVIISIIGLLAGLGITAFKVYRSNAAYSVVEVSIRDARTAIEASLNDPDNPPLAVPLTAQTAQGVVTDAAASQFLPGFRVPRSTKFQVSYDPTCTVAACQSELVQVNHCKGDEFARWVRFGDGVDVLLEHLAGTGCP